MNKRIADNYLKQARIRDLTERELREAIYAAIRCDDAELLELCMGKLPTDEEYWGEKEYPAYFAIREMASSEIIRILAENGFKLPDYPELLPFNGTPEEIISLLMKDRGIDMKEATSLLLHNVNYYLDVMSKGYSCFRVPFRIDPEDEYAPGFFLYLDEWLSELAILLDEEKLNYDEENTGLSAGLITRHPELIGTFKTLINTRFFDKDNLGWYMSRALSGDNEEAFDILLDMSDEKALQDIDTYPRTSIRLLNQLFDRGILIPGTDKAYEAFRRYISLFKKVDEEEELVLRAIMHPSYGSRRDDDGDTILMHAIFNKDFAPYLYPVLVTSIEELNARNNKGRTALYYLAISDYPECIGTLARMGAIPFCIDEKGNNVLHVLFDRRKRWHTLDDIEYVMGYLPNELITMKNAEGKTPFDLLEDMLSG